MQPVDQRATSGTAEDGVLSYPRLIVGAILFMVILGLIGTGSLQSLDRRVRERIVDGLETVLATTHQALVLWLEQRQNTIEETASRNEVREVTSTLLDGGKRAIDLRKSRHRPSFVPFLRRFRSDSGIWASLSSTPEV